MHAQSRARAHVQRREGASQHEHYKIAKQAGWESTILDELKALAEYWIFDFREIRTPAAPPASRGGARRQPRRPHVPFGWMEMALAPCLLGRVASTRTSELFTHLRRVEMDVPDGREQVDAERLKESDRIVRALCGVKRTQSCNFL